MALGTTGITTAAVGGVLGTSSRKLSVLCQHSNINKWAKGKPVAYAQSAGLTDADRKLANHGFDLNHCYSVDIGTLFTNAASNKDWEYTPPTGGTSQPFRLGDFRSYNASAVAPYNYNSFPVSLETYNTTAEVSFKINKNTDNSEIDITDFVKMEDANIGSWRYAIAYKHSSWANSDIQFMYGPYVSAATNEIIINGTFPTTGTFYILPIVTRETGTTTDVMDSVFLPNGYRSLVVERKYSYASITFDTQLYPWFDETTLYGIGGIINLSITNFTSGVSVPTVYGRLIFTVYCYDAYGSQLGYFTIDPNDSSNEIYYTKGTGVQALTLDYMYGQSAINISDYCGYASEIRKMEIYAETVRTSGNGLFTFSQTYLWEITR